MFLPPPATFADVPGIGWNDVLQDWPFAFVGLAGAAVFVADAYWYLYARDPEPTASADGRRADDRGRERAGAAR